MSRPLAAECICRIESIIHIEQNIYFMDADQQEVGCRWLLESWYYHVNLRRGCIDLALMSANGWHNIQALWA